MNIVLISVFAYIALQLAIAFWFSRKSRNEEDYLLAGRSLGPWLATFAVFATWFGAETCIGATGEAYLHGLSGVLTDPFGYTLGIMAVALLCAIPLWRRGIVTLADLFQRRYGVGVERLAAIIMIPTSVLWAAAQVRAFGQVLSSTSELGLFAAITLAAGVVITYTAVGGMWANAVTDLVQGVVMVVGILLLGVVFVQMGGVERIVALPMEKLSLRGERNWLGFAETLAVPIFSTIAAQELASRVLAMRSPALARKATFSAALLYFAIGLIPVTIGLAAVSYLGASVDHEQVLSLFAEKYLPLPLYVIFLGALVSAILSTLSGALLVAGSLAAHNIVLPVLSSPRSGRIEGPVSPGLTDADKIRLNRIGVILFGATAYVIALSSESVYGLVQEAASLGSAGVLVLMLFSLWGEKFGGALSAYTALLAGLVVYVACAHLLESDYPYLTSVTAALVAYLAAIPFSPATRKIETRTA